MKNIIFLDLDGVLITTPRWKIDVIHSDGYSDFNKTNVQCINQFFSCVEAELWLSSSHRTTKNLAEFDQIFANRNIHKKIDGFLPISRIKKSRFQEINSFLKQNTIRNFLIIDDDQSLNDLKSNRKGFWVKTSPLIGFNS
jgi:HAD domain in Swiss Army Knife RNA repair proteins